MLWRTGRARSKSIVIGQGYLRGGHTMRDLEWRSGMDASSLTNKPTDGSPVQFQRLCKRTVGSFVSSLSNKLR